MVEGVRYGPVTPSVRWRVCSKNQRTDEGVQYRTTKTAQGVVSGYRNSSFNCRGVYLILGLLGEAFIKGNVYKRAAFISKIK